MKKLLAILLLLGGIAGIQSCSGPMGPIGPPGPQGPQGQAGINIQGQVFEREISFTAANQYRVLIPYGRTIRESDKVVAFLLWEIDNGTDVWRPLPQTVFFQQGLLMYNYDFTRVDISFFLDSNFPLNQVPADFRNNQVFRFIIIPAQFANSRIDLTDYHALVAYLGIQETDIIKLQE
jgi:hypothetical protein